MLNFICDKKDTNEAKPGVFIDIDGVVLKGGKPFEWSKKAIHVIKRQKLKKKIFICPIEGTVG